MNRLPFFAQSLLMLVATQAVEPVDFAPIGVGYDREIAPLVERGCLSCHDADSRKGELDLERFASLDDVRTDPKVWQQVVEQMEAGEMPPKDKKALSEDEKARLLGWVKTYLRAEALAGAGDPGPVVLRRLSNAEYTYTIQDLTSVASLEPTKQFPVDSAAGEGFTNTGDALAMSPALFEKYLEAGKQIAEHVVLLPDGFRFSDKASRRDQSDSIVEDIRSFYRTVMGTEPIDFSYRDQVGAAAPLDEREGRLNPVPYLAALNQHRDLVNPNWEAIAQEKGINGPYLQILADALLGDGVENASLLSDLSRRLRTQASDHEVAEMGEWVRAWQDRLWKFNPVGHLGGYVHPWQQSADSLTARQEVQLTLKPSTNAEMTTLYLNVAAGDEVVRWEYPRIVRAGKAPIMLRDLRELSHRFARFRRGTLGTLDQLLAVAFLVKDPDNHASVLSLAQGHGVDSLALEVVLQSLGLWKDDSVAISGYLTEARQGVAGQEAISGWGFPGLGDLSLLGNRSDTTWHIPGEARAHRIVVHPHPERWVAAGWKSPISGAVRIEAVVHDRHGCGNGTRWSLVHRRGSQERLLQSGTVGVLQAATIPTVDSLTIRKGDLLSLVIDAKDGNHSCDLTEIDLVISELGSEERRWSLCEDCADTMLAGNPHADTHGNLETWHFYSGLSASRSDHWRPYPQGSLMAKWLATDDETVAKSLAAELQNLLAMDGLPEGLDESDRALISLLKAPDGLLFAHTRMDALMTGVSAETQLDKSVGLDPSKFTEEGHLLMKGPQTIMLQLPRALIAGANVAATVVFAEGSQGPVQVSVTMKPLATLTEPDPRRPFMVSPGSAAEQRLLKAHETFRRLFPAALCYARVVPIDEVVTLLLYHREDEPLRRLMLDDDQRTHLDRLWDELHFVSHDAFRLETALEQILEFSTQDADPSKFDPMLEPVAQHAKSLQARLRDCEPAQVDALLGFAPKVYRRSLSPQETHGVRALYHSLRSDSLTHEQAFKLTLARLFAAPAFLYRAEEPVPGRHQGPISAWEQGTRLSYFLWASAPDERLFQAAAAGDLSDPDQLWAEAERMLTDPRVARLSEQFACQWLHVRDFDQFDEKNESLYPNFGNLRGAMDEEMRRFFTDLFQRNGSILDILQADHTFANESLADFYGLPEVVGWQRMTGLREYGRGGVLGMAATLAKHSGASRTSPTLRGNWVSEVLLGEKLPKPPDGVPTLPETVPKGLSTRQLIERHSSDPACAKCHARIDPYGFALEGFDTIGRRRADVAVDTKTRLMDGTALEGMDGLRHYLAETRRDAFVRQFCRKLLGYALARAVRLSDEPLLDEMAQALAVEGYRFHTAVACVIRSRQFREIRGAEARTSATH